MDEEFEEGQLVVIDPPEDEHVAGTVVSTDIRRDDYDGEVYYAKYGVEHPDGTQAEYEAEALESVESILRVKARQERDLVTQRETIAALYDKLAQKNIQLIQAGLIPVDVFTRLMPADALTISVTSEEGLRTRTPRDRSARIMRVEMAIDSRASHLGASDDLTPQVFDAILNKLQETIQVGWKAQR